MLNYHLSRRIIIDGASRIPRSPVFSQDHPCNAMPTRRVQGAKIPTTRQKEKLVFPPYRRLTILAEFSRGQTTY
jgi:hypothetical protein